MKRKTEKAFICEPKHAVSDMTVLCFSRQPEAGGLKSENGVVVLSHSIGQSEYIRAIKEASSDLIILLDKDRLPLTVLPSIVQQYTQAQKTGIGYLMSGKQKLWMGNIQNCWGADRGIGCSPVLIGKKSAFLKAYGGSDLAGGVIAGVAYSLQKTGGMKFVGLTAGVAECYPVVREVGKWELWRNYTWRIPGRYLSSGGFFKDGEYVRRDMVFRMFFMLFACFVFLFMPYISKDFGVTGDEFVDHRHAGYVLDYFAEGDSAALHQPQTALHLYGNSVQVVAAAICRWFDVDDYYELRHIVGGMIGATGILAAGWLGLRWGGGLCGLLSLVLMFFTPRFFGHSMNNLKDIPFATGYILSLFYTIRLFDHYPVFRLRHILGLILGIALALGTRSGGLVLYPMVFMYAGLFYVRHCGIRQFYKFGKYARKIGQILQILLLVFAGSYILSILLWPFALQKPLTAVFYSLSKFTHYNVGLRTIFGGVQMMSNMLPWNYAPKYLCIGMPLVTLFGCGAYLFYMFIRKKEFSLIGFFLLFAAIFPVYWVIHCHSNLYGGIRHLLFVMPPMVVIAGRFWSGMILGSRGYWKWVPAVIFIALLALPVAHTFRNHPNEYIYFNELVGGTRGAYGDYETDYYFNSLKTSADWFRKNVLRQEPRDRKIIVASQAAGIMEYYFRKDTNVEVIYSRYYEKYAKDWDYAIFGNVYVSPFQLKNGLFPPSGVLFAPVVDGCPMSFVVKRDTKMELQGFQYEKNRQYEKAIGVFKEYMETHSRNEEIWSRMGKLYYMTGQFNEAAKAFKQALSLHPSLNESLYMLALTHLELKDIPAAFKAVDRMLSENMASADAYYLRAVLYYRLRQYQQAITALNRVLTYRPNFDKAHILAGDIFRDNGDYEQAAKMYQQAMKHRNSINTAAQLADTWVRQKKYDQAEKLLSDIRQYQPSFYPLYKVESRMLLQEGKLKEADVLLKKMTNIDDDPELFVLRAMYAYSVHDVEGMEEMIGRALELNAGYAEAISLKERFLK